MQRKKNITLNLGCGKTKIPNTLGVDRCMIPGFVDIVHDLDSTPYPFGNNSIDVIHMYHVLEHLHNPLKIIEEIYRILKPGGIIYIRVPHFSSLGAFTDITHVRPFGYGSFDCFQPGNYQNFYSNARFKIISKKIKYFGLFPNYGLYEKYVHKNSCPIIYRPIVLLINFLIDLSPTFFERVWCYWVGGATEINVELQKIDNE